ncbi:MULTISPECIES: SLBB domain-containing protein [unclassified Thiocapsa]|uniref:SLBB domain-containing protein n=1 Tax=unclassified Thiocapsa TaxID=2641286 RepID=UPI0035B138EA
MIGKSIALMLLVVAVLAAMIVNAAEDYKVVPGDMIRIVVFGHQDLDSLSRVGELGGITFNPIGQVKVAGLTERDIERLLAGRLESLDIVKSAQVKVFVEEFNRPLLPVLGKVSRPGEYPIDAGSTVVQMIARAGGLDADAGDVAILTRPSGGGDTVTSTVELIRILEAGRDLQDVEVRSGDRIYVPPAPVVYVYGEVNRPGAYRLKSGMRVMQAISLAGGVSSRGTTRGLTVTRDVSGSATSVGVGLEDELQADDVLQVKESWF